MLGFNHLPLHKLDIHLSKVKMGIATLPTFGKSKPQLVSAAYLS